MLCTVRFIFHLLLIFLKSTFSGGCAAAGTAFLWHRTTQEFFASAGDVFFQKKWNVDTNVRVQMIRN